MAQGLLGDKAKVEGMLRMEGVLRVEGVLEGGRDNVTTTILIWGVAEAANFEVEVGVRFQG